MRGILSAYLGAAPETLQIGAGANGKPVLAGGPRFNLTHSEGVGLLAVSDRREVGVDVEAVRPVPEADAIVSRWVRPTVAAALPPSGPERDLAFLSLWTRREAVLKGLGVGLSGADEVGPADEARWTVVDLSPGPGYVGALAVERAAG